MRRIMACRRVGRGDDVEGAAGQQGPDDREDDHVVSA